MDPELLSADVPAEVPVPEMFEERNFEFPPGAR